MTVCECEELLLSANQIMHNFLFKNAFYSCKQYGTQYRYINETRSKVHIKLGKFSGDNISKIYATSDQHFYQQTATMLSPRVQESAANAKGSARQPWYIVRNSLNQPPLWIAQQYQRNLYIVEKYFQCATIPSLTVLVCLHSFSRCCLPNMPTSAKFWANLNLQQFKVIQGRWFWYQSKGHSGICDFLSCIVSEIRRLRPWLKIAYFSYPSLIRRPHSLSSLSNFTERLSVRKLESSGYSVVKVAWS